MTVDLMPDGVRWHLNKLVADWLPDLPIQAATALNEYLEDCPNLLTANELVVPGEVVATWPEAAALQLGLPRNCPLGFDIRLAGVMGRPGARILARWLQPGRTVPAHDAIPNKLWLSWQGRTYRIPSPIYEVLLLADRFNQVGDASLEDQFQLWAQIRAVLGEERTDKLTDTFLRQLRIITASALTFSIGADKEGDLQLYPVLLTSQSKLGEGESSLVRALTEEDEELFPLRLDQMREGVPTFPLNQGTYVVAEEPLRKALAAVRKLRQASPEQRKRAAMYPEAVIREVMNADESEPIVFVEAEKYAERVTDVGEWTPPVVPWIKISSQNWGAPPTGGVRIGGAEVPLDVPVVEQAINDMRTALKENKPAINIAGRSVAASAVNVKALEQLHEALTKPARDTVDKGGEEAGASKVLIIETNFDDSSYVRTFISRRPGKEGLPHGLKTRPKKHQEAGLHWLQRHWLEGSRGAMLCDDMGLGKTYQALAFCLWLRESMEDGLIPKKPLLVVAPVGLLRNWEAEISEHLFSPGLGEVIRAYGDHTKALKRGRHLDGTASLDTARLMASDVVLTNYETVSDYQLSFGAVPFAAVVLDEAQKVKSPKARMTHAVKALNTDFVLAMTGTPVENRLADLWCIADTVQPGALGDLKTFSPLYESEGADVGELRRRIWQDEASLVGPPKLLLRRLKTEKLDGLPEKQEHLLKITMPARQFEAYQRALVMRELVGPEGTLGMIHALRRISLHPSLVEGDVGVSELKVEDSARFLGMIQVLDEISLKNEKVLIFLESLDLQDTNQLPLLLQRRYGLKRSPMVINGQVSTEARQARVDSFQRESGFDVMLLSPQAGGVGLTLTAANHVIHLSRWWNPAVEDQCSDRVYRIGQYKPVHIYYPLAVLPENEEHSFDWQLQLLMERKRKLAQNLLAAPAFTKEDYQALMAGIHY